MYCLLCVLQQTPGTGNYSMSCRVYAAAAAAAAAAACQQRSGVVDVDGGTTINYGRSCHDAATTFCATRESAGHYGPLYGYPAAYGAYGADSGGGPVCSTAGFVESGDTDDVSSRYMIGDRRILGDMSSLYGGDGFMTSSSTSSAALVELNDFVCRGGRLMRTGDNTSSSALCSRLVVPGVTTQLPSHVDPSSDSSATDTSTTTPTMSRSSCLYSSAAKAAVSKSVCSQDASNSSAKINGAVMSFPTNPSGTSTCEKAKTSSSGNHRNNHLTGRCESKDDTKKN